MDELLQWAAILIPPLSLAVGWLWTSVQRQAELLARLDERTKGHDKVGKQLSELNGELGALRAELKVVRRIVDRHEERYLMEEQKRPAALRLGSAGLLEDLASDEPTSNLGGARADLVQLRVAQQPSGGIVVDVAVAAE